MSYCQLGCGDWGGGHLGGFAGILWVDSVFLYPYLVRVLFGVVFLKR